MKRIIITFAITALVFIPLFSQNVTIPDANFLAALIEEGVDTDEDGQISFAEAEAVTTMEVSDKSIVDMTGIEAFIYLEALFCNLNDIAILDVSSNSALIRLYCHSNQLTSLDLSNNTALIYLHCIANQLTSLDVSSNTTLQDLICGDNQLTSLDFSNNTDLTYLFCSDNQLTSLDVSGCTELIYLACWENQLTSLDVSNNNALVSLQCGSNALTALDVSKNTSLILLDCNENNMVSLDISSNPELSLLHCGSNPIVNLDVSYNTNLGLGDVDAPGLYFSAWAWYFKHGSVALILSDMPTLNQVCVWELPFPPENSYLKVDTFESPNVYFDNTCGVGNTGISSYAYSDTKFSIYPNPTNSILTIETENPDCYSIEIHSLNGQLIYKEEMEGNTKQIDMTPFSKGVYFITVRSDAWVRTEKVVKY